ncbi:hypothetical protein L6R52_33645 [Myxococcota bacterium]|nr:hypothetical protein [Myxococcota bacterium]
MVRSTRSASWVARALFATLAAMSPGAALASEPLTLKIAIVQDPDFPPVERELVTRALELASREFASRFGADAPRFDVVNEYTVAGFLGAYALPVDPQCRPRYDARYRGGGPAELDRHKAAALKFFQKWELDALIGFIDASERAGVKSYEDVYAYYSKKYSKTVDAMRGLKTPAGTALVEPDKSARRSFVAWTCALLRQKDYDIILTNAFMLADLMSEPHPHSVFGKAKIGGIATRSPARTALGGQALLATTFGIDTTLKEFAELPGAPATFDERAKILGIYLLAHEVAHAIFGIPDVFDHPLGCVMTSRPGATYRDGLAELEAHPEVCSKCRPYVEARQAQERAERLYAEGSYPSALSAVMRSVKLMPAQYHGSKKKRMAQLMVLAAKIYAAQGQTKSSERMAIQARDLDPTSPDVAALFERPTLATSNRDLAGTSTVTAPRTSTATQAR